MAKSPDKDWHKDRIGQEDDCEVGAGVPPKKKWPDHDIDKSACPVWTDDQEDVDAILAWAPNASVEWSDTFVRPKRDGGEGEVVLTRRPEFALWSLVWKAGCIGYCSLKEDTEKDRIRARTAAALFIHLWCKGVDAAVAAHCSEAYVNFFEITGEPECCLLG